MLCVFSVGVASLAAGFVLGMRTLPRVFWRCLWMRSFPAILVQILDLLSWYFGNWSGCGGPPGDSEGLMELNRCFHGPSNRLCEVKFLLVVPLLVECSHGSRSLLLDVFFTLGGLETGRGVMTKLIVPDITVFMSAGPVDCDAR